MTRSSRTEQLWLVGFLSLLTLVLVACPRSSVPAQPAPPAVSSRGVLTARPGRMAPQSCAPGERPLGGGMLFVPEAARTGRRLPMIVLLHGARGGAAGIYPLLRADAEKRGFILLAPNSRGRTWDLVLGGFGPDVEFLDHTLAQIFADCPVDTGHLAVGGFSDGASYALSLGISNGALFSHVMAFSPGFMHLQETRGRPAVFISHGKSDTVLPFDNARHIAGTLEQTGHLVYFRQFDGGHRIPREIVDEALRWFH